jgi:hypothetical protein
MAYVNRALLWINMVEIRNCPKKFSGNLSNGFDPDTELETDGQILPQH